MVLSVPLVIEYESVMSWPQHLLRARASLLDVGLLLDAVVRQGELTSISYLWRPQLRDPGDEMVSETAVNGRADRILTFNLVDFAGAKGFGIAIGQPGPAWRERQEGLA